MVSKFSAISPELLQQIPSETDATPSKGKQPSITPRLIPVGGGKPSNLEAFNKLRADICESIIDLEAESKSTISSSTSLTPETTPDKLLWAREELKVCLDSTIDSAFRTSADLNLFREDAALLIDKSQDLNDTERGLLAVFSNDLDRIDKNVKIAGIEKKYLDEDAVELKELVKTRDDYKSELQCCLDEMNRLSDEHEQLLKKLREHEAKMNEKKRNCDKVYRKKPSVVGKIAQLKEIEVRYEQEAAEIEKLRKVPEIGWKGLKAIKNLQTS